MGLAVDILNEKKYERKSYQFNFGLIVTYDQFQDQNKRQVYEQIIRKIAAHLTIMEVDHEMLWIPKRKKYLNDFVQILFDKVNDPLTLQQGSFCIPLDFQNSFTFQFQPKNEKPPEVRDFDVPIFLNSETEIGYQKTVDQTSDILQKKINNLIDGRKHVKRIANEANMDLEIVRMCIQHLLFYKVISLIDLFQYTNVYAATDEITKLAYDQ